NNEKNYRNSWEKAYDISCPQGTTLPNNGIADQFFESIRDLNSQQKAQLLCIPCSVYGDHYDYEPTDGTCVNYDDDSSDCSDEIGPDSSCIYNSGDYCKDAQEFLSGMNSLKFEDYSR